MFFLPNPACAGPTSSAAAANAQTARMAMSAAESGCWSMLLGSEK